jgi:dihydrofolate reductase
MNLIACVDKNLGLGKDGQLLYHIKSDLRCFKALTTGSIVIMGRETMNSLPMKKLPNRLNIVLTHHKVPSSDPEVMFITRPKDVIAFCRQKSAFCIGGESIYREFLPYCDAAYITLVDDERDADKYFPEDIIHSKDWRLTTLSLPEYDSDEDVYFRFAMLVRNIG